MFKTENQFYRAGWAWCIQHPVMDGVACGVAFFIVSSLLIAFAFPAWALTIPITERIVISLDSLQPWIATAVAFAVYWEMKKTRQKATEAVTVSKEVAAKVDGVLAEAYKGKVAEGARLQKIAGDEKAETLARGQSEGRAEAIALAAATPALVADGKGPIPVTDDRTATAAEVTAKETGRLADATVKIADAAGKK